MRGRINTIFKRSTPPKAEKIISAEEQAQIKEDQTLIKALSEKIDEYEIENPLTKKIETAKESHARVFSILEEEGMSKLYEGTPQQGKKGKPYPQDARKAFIEYLVKTVLKDGKRCEAEQEVKEGEVDPRIAHPEDYYVSMKNLLGKEGVELYNKALAEERNSKNYRDAVLLGSTKYKEDYKWKDRLILWVGGPSASGKSHNAPFALEKISQEILEKDTAGKPDFQNVIISVDGGVEREMSQMRQLALQVALQKGYSAIKDLTSKLGIKTLVKSAALNSSNAPNIMIPDTFTNPIKKILFDAKKLDKIPNSKQVFAEIIGEDSNPERFFNTTVQGGIMRASNQDFSPENTENRQITMNNRKLCESKKYSRKHFKRGKQESKKIRKKYLKQSKYKIWAPIVNDQVFVKLVKSCQIKDGIPNWSEDWQESNLNDKEKKMRVKLTDGKYYDVEAEEIDPITHKMRLKIKNGDWIEAWQKYIIDDPRKKERMSARDLKAWNQYKKNGGSLSASAWWKNRDDKKEKAEPQVRIHTNPIVGAPSDALEELNNDIREGPITFMLEFEKLKKEENDNPVWKKLSLEKVIDILQNDPERKDFNKIFNLPEFRTNSKNTDFLLTNIIRLIANAKKFFNDKKLVLNIETQDNIDDIEDLIEELNELVNKDDETINSSFLDEDDSEDPASELAEKCDEAYQLLYNIYQSLGDDLKAQMVNHLLPASQRTVFTIKEAQAAMATMQNSNTMFSHSPSSTPSPQKNIGPKESEEKLLESSSDGRNHEEENTVAISSDEIKINITGTQLGSVAEDDEEEEKEHTPKRIEPSIENDKSALDASPPPSPSASTSSSKDEDKPKEANAPADGTVAYAKITRDGFNKYLTASNSDGGGMIGRTFDSPEPDEILPALKEWIFKEVYLKHGLIVKLDNGEFQLSPLLSKYSEDLFVFKSFLKSRIAQHTTGCNIDEIDYDPILNKIDMYILGDTNYAASYYFYKNELYYVNRNQGKCVKLDVKPKDITTISVKLASKLNKKIVTPLSDEDVQQIKLITKNNNINNNSSFFFLLDKLYLQNRKGRYEKLKTPPEKVDELRNKFNKKLIGSPKESLSDDELKFINNLTGHSHLEDEDHSFQPSFINQIDGLNPWFKSCFSPELANIITNIIYDISSKANEVTFDKNGNVQKWLYEAFKDPNTGDDYLKKLLQQHGNFGLLQLKFAVITALREGVNRCSPLKDSDSEEKLSNLSVCIDTLMEQQTKYYFEIKKNTVSFNYLRHPSKYIEDSIKNQVRMINRLEKELCYNPFEPFPVVAMTTNLNHLNSERDKFIEDHCIRTETVSSFTSNITVNTHPVLFEKRPILAQLASDQNSKNTWQSFQKITFTFNNNQPTSIEINQYQSLNRKTSDLLQIGEELNTAKILSDTLLKKYPAILSDDQCLKFFKKAIKTMREKFNDINQEGINDILSTLIIDTTERQLTTEILFKNYKLQTEQLDAYLGSRVEQPYVRTDYFPSDLFIRTAKHHVDEFAKKLIEQGKTPVIRITKAFDPHYAEAIQLYCHMKGYACENKSGWKDAANLDEKKANFKEFFVKRYEKVKEVRNDIASEKIPITKNFSTMHKLLTPTPILIPGLTPDPKKGPGKGPGTRGGAGPAA